MQIHNFEQRSPEWHEIRRGKITASNFGKVITSTGKPASAQESFVNELIAEMITGEVVHLEPTFWMQHGIDTEPRACAVYEMQCCVDVDHVGFCVHDEIDAGCSPDGLIGTEGGLEIKCPAPNTHIGYLRDGRIPAKYIPQVQGSMWITGRPWWDFMSFHPHYPELIVRVPRDDDFIQKLEHEIKKVLEKRDNCILEIGERNGV